MSRYRPHQHHGKPIGCNHETIFASVELYADDPPDFIELGDFLYARQDKPKDDRRQPCETK